MAKITETELYQPVKAFWERRGFQVKGEVANCDLVAVRDNCLVVVELKSSFTLDLVLQGLERKKVTNLVYVAVPLPDKSADKRWHRIINLCRQLNLGLLVVSRGPQATVNPLCQPHGNNMGGQGIKVLAEFRELRGDPNVGGKPAGPLVTVYRQQAVAIAKVLQAGPARVCDIAATTGNTKAGRILYDNHYGWFERVKHGVYCLSAKGRQEAQQYAQLLR